MRRKIPNKIRQIKIHINQNIQLLDKYKELYLGLVHMYILQTLCQKLKQIHFALRFPLLFDKQKKASVIFPIQYIKIIRSINKSQLASSKIQHQTLCLLRRRRNIGMQIVLLINKHQNNTQYTKIIWNLIKTNIYCYVVQQQLNSPY
ncbi:hypothetical protein pb186bvf_017987 [Paramecium bursaria]